jgi:hypothetical protein
MAIKIKVGSTWTSIKGMFLKKADNSWYPIKKGYVYISNSWNLFFSSYSGPVQLTSPSISGTGAALTSVAGSSGTYQSGTYTSKTSYVGVVVQQNMPVGGIVNGLTTSSLSNKGSSPYTITQSDATTPVYYFYYVDAVTGNDSNIYYYYSSSIQSYIPTVTDDYTRTVSSGLGTMSSGFTYNLFNLNTSWGVDGAVAYSALPAAGATPANYPIEAIELSGKTDITAQIDIPLQGSGPGIVFWAASGTKWWAASSINGTYSGTTYTCSPGSYNYYNCGTTGTSTVTDCLGPTQSFDGATQGIANSSATSNCGTCSVSTGTSVPGTSYACGPSTRIYTGSQTLVAVNQSNVGQPCALESSAYPNFTYYVVTPFSYITYYATCNYESRSVATCSGSSAYSNNTTAGTCGCGPVQTATNCTGSNLYTDSSGTGCSGCSITTGTGTYYYTDLVIYSANGSAVSSMQVSSSHIAATPLGYATIDVGRLQVVTSGNSIVVSAYDNSKTNLLGTLSYTANSPTKTTTNGSSYAGVIRTPSTHDSNIYNDNLSIQ